ncbi:unnamed protein product [Tuber melanosporum]|uniref:(Perigord truffle) hypothetical protein n=1 Tax=Tuber melanosporum (strain Mel28) TaxID=656061 RepID=D5G779_TUBMM|nr:uncharacterized protein GSTUM_00002504001 [Tuber melanosporum]CAZ80372.1 unnamed protein product [Tuber melanosporum]
MLVLLFFYASACTVVDGASPSHEVSLEPPAPRDAVVGRQDTVAGERHRAGISEAYSLILPVTHPPRERMRGCMGTQILEKGRHSHYRGGQPKASEGRTLASSIVPYCTRQTWVLLELPMC